VCVICINCDRLVITDYRVRTDPVKVWKSLNLM